ERFDRAREPVTSGRTAITVLNFASRYSGRATISAYVPRETLFTNGLPPTSPRSIRISSPSSPSAASARVGSSRSSPRSRAKWFPSPRRDGHERDVASGRDLGDESLGAVAACGSEQIRTIVDTLLEDIDRVQA